MFWLWLFLGCTANDSPTIEVKEVVDTRPAPVIFSKPFFEPTDDRYAASHILIAWEGAKGSIATRTQEEAKEFALELHIGAKTMDFEKMARENSDGPSGRRGGNLGVYATGTMIPVFESAVASTEVGGIAPVVESPFGYHIIKREKIDAIKISHLVFPHREAKKRPSAVSQTAAREAADQALAKIRGGASFSQVSIELKTSKMANKERDLGWVVKGEFFPDFETAAFALEVGKVSEVISTPYGFHIIYREE